MNDADQRLHRNPGIFSDLLAVLGYLETTATIDDQNEELNTAPLQIGGLYSTAGQA